MSLWNLFPCLHFITSSHHLCLISALQLSMLYLFFRQDKAISGNSFTSNSSSKNSNNSSGLKSFKVSWANFVVFLLQLLQNSLTCLWNGDIIPPSVSTICKRGFEKKLENHFLKQFFLVCKYFLFSQLSLISTCIF